MERRTLLWIIIGALFLATLFVSFKAGNVASATDTISAAAAATQSAPSSAMVGGC